MPTLRERIERDAEIERLYRDGWKAIWIARKVDLGVERVCQILLARGLRRRRKPRRAEPRVPKFSSEMRATRDAKIVKLYRAGWTQAAIGEEVDLTESRVCQILRSHGVTGAEQAARRAEERETERAETLEGKSEARTAADQELGMRWLRGDSTLVIGLVLGVERSSVGRRAKTLGLPQRRPGPRGRLLVQKAGESPEAVARRKAERRVDAEIKASRRALVTPTCWCGSDPAVTCLCGRRCCEDHAVMTVDGPRCAYCMSLADEEVG